MTETDPPIVDGVAMTKSIRADSIAELSAVVRDLAAAGTALYPVGGGTWLSLGRPPARPGVALDATALDRIVDYPAEDLTITVEAGVRLADLEATLNAKGQTFPIAVRSPPGATLGGLLATSACGPRRFGYGLPRDFVLGLDVVDVHGRRIHGGGRVVKNVAGYDLPKMHLGALGTLGVIVEATLKLKPLPEARAWTVARFAQRPDAILAELRRAPLRPTAVELFNPAAAGACKPLGGDRRWALALSFEDCREAVAKQLEIARATLQTSAAILELDANDADDLWRLPNGWLHAAPGNVVVKAVARPTDLGRSFDAAERAFPGAAVGAHAGSGVLWVEANIEAAADLAARMRTLRSQLHEFSGHAVVTDCPSAWKTGDLVWGEPRPDRYLMESLRGALDPRRLLNPGRFVVD